MSANAPPNPVTPERPANAPPNSDSPESNKTLTKRIYEGEAPETTETNIRLAAYTNRIRTIMTAAHRYVAYTSDIGESFRPVTHPTMIRTAYGISWLYLTGDVLHEGYKAYLSNQATLRGGHPVSSSPEWVDSKSSSSGGVAKNVVDQAIIPKAPLPLSDAKGNEGDVSRDEGKDLLHPKGKVPFLKDYRTVMVQRAMFQSLASMALPAFTIHTVVRFSGQALKNNKNKVIRTWVPVGLGLLVVPALPYIFDHPVECTVEWAFKKGYETFAGGRKEVHEKKL